MADDKEKVETGTNEAEAEAGVPRTDEAATESTPEPATTSPAETASAENASTETAAADPVSDSPSSDAADAPSEPPAAVATEPVTSDAPAPAEAEVPTTPTEPVASTPTETVSTGSTPSEPAAAEKPRPKLNPTGADSARPVGNVGGATPALSDQAKQAITGSTPAPADGVTTEGDEADVDRAVESIDPAASAATPSKAPATPVDVPRAVEGELDADLEAEIQAAMSSDTSEPVVSVPAESEEGDAEQGDGTPEMVTITDEDLEPGTSLNAKIASIHGDNVFVDLGTRMNGVVTKRQFQSNRPPAVGQIIKVTVDKVDQNEGLVTCSLPKGVRRVSGNWDALAVGQVVECYVNKTNKGGLEIAVSGIRGFLPASQIDLRFVDDMETYVGQKMQVEVTEVNPKKRNLVVSRRKILQAERAEAEKTVWQDLAVNAIRSGVVKTIKPYGAFVDIGGVDGFLHVGEISWNRINDPSAVLSVGQKIDVKVLKLDAEAKKISLGMKQLEQNPWSNASTNYPEGTTVKGKVTRTADFGAFVELEKGVEGLIHISELDHARVRRVTDVLKTGQDVEAQVLEVDGNRRRISLSLKALKDKPVPPKDEDLAPGGDQPYVRKRKEPLLGGTSTDEATGGLFGNPSDFGG